MNSKSSNISGACPDAFHFVQHPGRKLLEILVESYFERKSRPRPEIRLLVRAMTTPSRDSSVKKRLSAFRKPSTISRKNASWEGWDRREVPSFAFHPECSISRKRSTLVSVTSDPRSTLQRTSPISSRRRLVWRRILYPTGGEAVLHVLPPPPPPEENCPTARFVSIHVAPNSFRDLGNQSGLTTFRRKILEFHTMPRCYLSAEKPEKGSNHSFRLVPVHLHPGKIGMGRSVCRADVAAGNRYDPEDRTKHLHLQGLPHPLPISPRRQTSIRVPLWSSKIADRRDHEPRGKIGIALQRAFLEVRPSRERSLVQLVEPCDAHPVNFPVPCGGRTLHPSTTSRGPRRVISRTAVSAVSPRPGAGVGRGRDTLSNRQSPFARWPSRSWQCGVPSAFIDRKSNSRYAFSKTRPGLSRPGGECPVNRSCGRGVCRMPAKITSFWRTVDHAGHVLAPDFRK